MDHNGLITLEARVAAAMSRYPRALTQVLEVRWRRCERWPSCSRPSFDASDQPISARVVCGASVAGWPDADSKGRCRVGVRRRCAPIVGDRASMSRSARFVASPLRLVLLSAESKMSCGGVPIWCSRHWRTSNGSSGSLAGISTPPCSGRPVSRMPATISKRCCVGCRPVLAGTSVVWWNVSTWSLSGEPFLGRRR